MNIRFAILVPLCLCVLSFGRKKHHKAHKKTPDVAPAAPAAAGAALAANGTTPAAPVEPTDPRLTTVIYPLIRNFGLTYLEYLDMSVPLDQANATNGTAAAGAAAPAAAAAAAPPKILFSKKRAPDGATIGAAAASPAAPAAAAAAPTISTAPVAPATQTYSNFSIIKQGHCYSKMGKESLFAGSKYMPSQSMDTNGWNLGKRLLA